MKKYVLSLGIAAMVMGLWGSSQASAGSWHLYKVGCHSPSVYGYAYDSRKYGDSYDVKRAYEKEMRTRFDSGSCLGNTYKGFDFNPSPAGTTSFDSESDVRISLRAHIKQCKRDAKKSQYNRDNEISPSEACVNLGRAYINID